MADSFCLLRWGVSWTPRTHQLLLHAAYEDSCAGTKSGSKLKDESGRCCRPSRCAGMIEGGRKAIKSGN